MDASAMIIILILSISNLLLVSKMLHMMVYRRDIKTLTDKLKASGDELKESVRKNTPG